MKEKWTFSYTAEELADAADAKLQHHKNRFAWWTDKYNAKFTEVKEKGMSVNQSMSSANTSMLFQTSHYVQPTFNIDPKLQAEFNECQAKVNEHKYKVIEFTGWAQSLRSQGKKSFDLDIQDWIFFFGGING